jgi:hypothetical protein
LLRYRGTVTDRAEYKQLFEDSITLQDILQQDREWVDNTFQKICDALEITADDVITVEKYLLNGAVGYGGQCDMLYRDQQGNVVLADLKTSSGFRQKYLLQGVAYQRAVEQADKLPDEVDRIEVWRLYPDDKEWQIHTHEVPPHMDHLVSTEDSYDSDDTVDSGTGKVTTKHFFDDKYGNWEYDGLDDAWKTFAELVEEGLAFAEEFGDSSQREHGDN